MVPAWLDLAPGRLTFLADSARHSQLLPTLRQEASVPKRQGADVRRLPVTCFSQERVMPAAPPGVGQALTLFSNKPSGRETAVLFQRRATNPANEGSLLIWQRGTFLGPVTQPAWKVQFNLPSTCVCFSAVAKPGRHSP